MEREAAWGGAEAKLPEDVAVDDYGDDGERVFPLAEESSTQEVVLDVVVFSPFGYADKVMRD
jgi:hypothetical protein